MNILPQVANLKRHISDRRDKPLDPGSDSNLPVKSTETDVSIPDRENDETPNSDSSALVKWSPTMQSLLDEPPSSLPVKLIAGGIVFCIFFILWAWFGKIDQVGKAQGRLVPKGEAYKVESIESAKIDEIAVKEGQQVRAGQLIARLDSEQETREVERLKELVSAYELELNQKRNLLEKAELETKTNRMMAESEVQGQQSAIESAIAQLEVSRNLLERRQSELLAQLNRQDNVQNLSALDGEKLGQIEEELKQHEERLERLKPLAEQGAISQEAIFQAQQSKRETEKQLTEYRQQIISNSEQQIFQSGQASREMEADIAESQGQLVSQQKEIEQLKAELAHKKAERQRIELEAQQKVEQLKLEIGQTESKIAETKNQLAGATSRLEKTALRSPVDGTVLSFNVTNTGKVIQPGETVAEIAPSQAKLVLSAVLPDREAGFVKKGMPAQVKFDAYSYQDYGTIPGKIISVSPDAKTDETLGAVYRVKIELERNYVTDNLKKVLFKPGQTASADIVIRQQRIIDVLLDPIKKLQQDGIDL